MSQSAGPAFTGRQEAMLAEATRAGLTPAEAKRRRRAIIKAKQHASVKKLAQLYRNNQAEGRRRHELHTGNVAPQPLE